MSRPGTAPGDVGGAFEHDRRWREVTRRVERGDDDRARAVDLDRAIGHPERLRHVGRGEVCLGVEWGARR